MAGEERQFQRWFVGEWEKGGRWAENIHPSFGTKTGIPDLLLLVSNLMVPIEVKTGVLKDGYLKVSDVRPAQIRWSRKFVAHGGKCGLIAGLRKDKEWEIAVVQNEAWWTGRTVFSDGEFVVVESSFRALIHLLSQ
jgi:Holliday junction resolvase